MNKESLKRALLIIAERIRDIATDIVPFFRGDLRKSITIDTSKLDNYHVKIGSNLPYARAVEEGRPTIVIKPKRKKSLKFKTKNNIVFSKKVVQPPRKPKPYLKPAFEKTFDDLSFLNNYFNEQFTDFFKEVIKFNKN